MAKTTSRKRKFVVREKDGKVFPWNPELDQKAGFRTVFADPLTYVHQAQVDGAIIRDAEGNPDIEAMRKQLSALGYDLTPIPGAQVNAEADTPIDTAVKTGKIRGEEKPAPETLLGQKAIKPPKARFADEDEDPEEVKANSFAADMRSMSTDELREYASNAFGVELDEKLTHKALVKEVLRLAEANKVGA